MIWSFIDQHHDRFGVEPLCRFLKVATSAWYRHVARKNNPDLRCQRDKQDELMMADIQRVWDENERVYGAEKVWKALNREGTRVARCTVERLMKRLNLQGVRRGKRMVTTSSDPAIKTPGDLVNRHFKASRPNQLWVSDFTYVSTWQGFVYVAFVIDVSVFFNIVVR